MHASTSQAREGGPVILLTILGIALDTINMQAHLPEERLAALLKKLESFVLLYVTALLGKLAFACKIIPAGRIFLRLQDTARVSMTHLDQR